MKLQIPAQEDASDIEENKLPLQKHWFHPVGIMSKTCMHEKAVGAIKSQHKSFKGILRKSPWHILGTKDVHIVESTFVSLLTQGVSK